jgi:uncharacterized coiled-coil protein SlyX
LERIEQLQARVAERDKEIADLKQQVLEQQARIVEQDSALNLWKVAAENAEECEFDEYASYAIPMPLFCDASEATERIQNNIILPALESALKAERVKTLEEAAKWFDKYDSRNSDQLRRMAAELKLPSNPADSYASNISGAAP